MRLRYQICIRPSTKWLTMNLNFSAELRHKGHKKCDFHYICVSSLFSPKAGINFQDLEPGTGTRFLPQITTPIVSSLVFTLIDFSLAP